MAPFRNDEDSEPTTPLLNDTKLCCPTPPPGQPVPLSYRIGLFFSIDEADREADDVKEASDIWLRLGFWLASTVVCFFANRGYCQAGWVNDCKTDRGWESLFLMENLQSVLMWGFLSGICADVVYQARFSHMFARGRWWFFLVMNGSGLVFAIIGRLYDNAKESVSASSGSYDSGLLVVYAIASVAALFTMIWHIWYARRVLSHRKFLEFVGSRVAIFGFYGLYSVLLVQNHSWHLHHYFIAWNLSLFGVFQHRISLLYLAITYGIFVQGVACFGASEIFFNNYSTYSYTYESGGKCYELYDCYQEKVSCHR